MPNYDSDVGAKMANVTRGGQVGVADAYPANELRKVRSMNEVALPPLTGILYDRRSYHIDRVAVALSELSIALDMAAEDGFEVRHVPGGISERPMSPGSIQPVSAPSRFPRNYEVELSVTFNQPF